MTDLATIVNRHRDEPSPDLPVQWALLRLLDSSGTRTLVDDLKALAGPWEVKEPTERLWEMLPDQAGLYMFVWRPWFRFEVAETPQGAPPERPESVSQILYVGQAGAYGDETGGTLRERYKSYRRHLRADASCLWQSSPLATRHHLMRYLTLRPLEYWFTTVDDRSQIKGLETRLLAMFNPPMNRQEKPRLLARASAPQPAFGR